MWKLLFTYRDYVGVKKNQTVIFKTEQKGLDYIKSHPTIKIISFQKSLDFIDVF